MAREPAGWLPDGRTTAGDCSRNDLGGAFQLRPGPLGLPAPGIEQLGRTIPATQPECEPKRNRECSDQTDQQGVDQLVAIPS